MEYLFYAFVFLNLSYEWKQQYFYTEYFYCTGIQR